MATNAQAQERKEGGLAQASFVGVLRAKPEKSRRIACLSLWPSFFVYGLFMASLACLSTKLFAGKERSLAFVGVLRKRASFLFLRRDKQAGLVSCTCSKNRMALNINAQTQRLRR